MVRGAQTGFRHRARLAVRGRAKNPKIGIFEAGSHRIVDIPRCLVHHPLINEVAAELRRAMIATHAAPYSDEAHRGLVRYVQVVVERPSRTAQVVVVTNDAAAASSAELLSELAARLGPRLHSLFWNGNVDRTNTILGPRWERRAGPEAVEERVGGARVFYPPGAFGQSHLDLADGIVARVQRYVPDGARVLELYAGVGPLGLGLVPRTDGVVFNEVGSDSLRGLALGIAALPAEVRDRARIAGGPSASHAGLVADADVVIADPPRKGLDREVRDALTNAPPRRFVYVACGFESFLTDATALLDSGRFRLSALSAFDLFPHTEHVEVVALLERKE